MTFCRPQIVVQLKTCSKTSLLLTASSFVSPHIVSSHYHLLCFVAVFCTRFAFFTHRFSHLLTDLTLLFYVALLPGCGTFGAADQKDQMENRRVRIQGYCRARHCTRSLIESFASRCSPCSVLCGGLSSDCIALFNFKIWVSLVELRQSMLRMYSSFCSFLAARQLCMS